MEQYPFYMNAAKYEKFLAEQTASMKSLLTEVGLIK
jgi:tripartite-type tricarboxylate transporter receptor subunit TctC